MLVLDGDPLKDIGLLASNGDDIRTIIKNGIAYKDELGFALGAVPAVTGGA